MRVISLAVAAAAVATLTPLGAGQAPDSASQLAVGQLFPPLSGEFLTGRKATLPQAAAGKVALLALGFSYDSRFPVEAWMTRFRAAFGSDTAVTFFEIPMIGGMARMGRWFIDSGMRKGTPKELHENVITVYGGTAPWKKRLRVNKPKEDDAYLVLLDRQGTIRWLYAGPPADEPFQQLSELVRSLLTSP